LVSFFFIWFFVVETIGNSNIKNMALILGKTTREISSMMRNHGPELKDYKTHPKSETDKVD
jgi:hypothetical protein